MEDLTFKLLNFRNFSKSALLVIVVIVIVVIALLNVSENKDKLTYNDLLLLGDGDFIIVNLGNAKISAEIARSSQKREQGLSGRKKLKDNESMLFIFEREGNYGFWMKEMLFNIDMIFIKDDIIVDMAENMPYPINENNIAGVSPKEKANLVLEINSGLVKKYNIKIGDKVEFLQPNLPKYPI